MSQFPAELPESIYSIDEDDKFRVWLRRLNKGIMVKRVPAAHVFLAHERFWMIHNGDLCKQPPLPNFPWEYEYVISSVGLKGVDATPLNEGEADPLPPPPTTAPQTEMIEFDTLPSLGDLLGAEVDPESVVIAASSHPAQDEPEEDLSDSTHILDDGWYKPAPTRLGPPQLNIRELVAPLFVGSRPTDFRLLSENGDEIVLERLQRAP